MSCKKPKNDGSVTSGVFRTHTQEQIEKRKKILLYLIHQRENLGVIHDLRGDSYENYFSFLSSRGRFMDEPLGKTTMVPVEENPFRNTFINQDDDKIYTEGLVITPDNKILEHVWLYDVQQNQVIDPYQQAINAEAYFGVPFEQWFLFVRAFDGMLLSVLEQDRNKKFSLLDKNFAEKAVWRCVE